MTELGGAATGMTVMVIRMWIDDGDFRARIMFEGGSSTSDDVRTVVVQSVDEACEVLRRAVDAMRPPPQSR